MKNSTKLLVAVSIITGVAGCGGGGGGTTSPSVAAEPGQTVTNTKLSILNYMGTTNLVKDGVVAVGITGTSSSTGTAVTKFPFVSPLAPQASAIVYMNSSQCDVYWDLTPIVDPATNLILIPNTGKKVFVPCGKTLACTATIKYLGTTGFADLSCGLPA
jgi:hypothetical protein